MPPWIVIKGSLEYFRKALDIAERIDDKVGICNYLMAISNVSKDLGDINKCDEYLNKALRIAISINDKNLITKLLYNISRIQMSKGDYIGASEQLQKVIDIANEENNKQMLSNSYNQLSIIHTRQGDDSKALEYSLLALKIDEQFNNKPAIFNRLINIVDIKSNQNEFESALETIQQASQIANELKDSMKIATCLNNKGKVYMRMKNPEALHCLQKALVILKDNNIVHKIDLLTNIGIIYINRGELELAQKNLDEALALAQKIDLKFACCKVWMEMGSLCFAQKQYRQAIAYAQKALDLAEKIGYFEIQKDSYKQISDLNVATGNYKDAYLNYTQYKLLNDSIFNDKNIRKQAILESSYKFDKEKQKYEMEKANHTLKIKNQRQIILFLVVTTLFILVLALTLYWSNKLKKKLLKLEIENINHELEYSQKEMASATLKLIQNSESDVYCVKMLEDIKNSATEEGELNVRSLINFYKNKSINSNWNEFETLFIKVNGIFYDKLNEKFPTLTTNERKLCVFLKLNMNNKDIAQITFQSEEALKKARLRLRKKLELDRDENLATFIQSI